MSDQTTIRSTTADDHELVSDLLLASYPVLMRAGYSDAVLDAALPAMTQANPVLLASGTFYVVQDNDGLAIGCGGWTFERPGSAEIVDGLAHIRHFATHPNRTGKGIGRLVYQCCEKNARQAGVGQFECYSSLNAEGYYASLGFTAIERLNVPMGPEIVFPAVRMTCFI